MIDTNAILAAYLKTAGTSLYTLIGTRVYCPRLPAGFANSQAALEVMQRGGQVDPQSSLIDVSVQIKCFGGTSSHAEATAVYRALCDRLHRAEMQTTASGVIMVAQKETEKQDLFEPDTGWPFCLNYWRILTRAAT